MAANSKIGDLEWRYPSAAPNDSGFLDVQSPAGHRIYWEEYGNPGGEPVMFIHGGPGGGCSPFMARFFDPERYRVILFDQRGCGKSTPNAATDSVAALTDNTTAHLISDINKMKAARGISGKMHVFGGSWGSTLSLAYAIAHPENVQTLILRGIFLCRRKDLDYLYQGNAATIAQAPTDTSKPGAYQMYPEAWADFVAVIPEAERHDMVAAYARVFAMIPKTEPERQQQLRAATAWSVWEGLTSYMAQDISNLGHFADPGFAGAFARIENHYFMNGAFLGGGSGDSHRDNNYILENIDRLQGIPAYIVHGRFDVVCPVFQADELMTVFKQAGHTQVEFHRTMAGHAQLERENYLALVDIMDKLPVFKP